MKQAIPHSVTTKSSGKSDLKVRDLMRLNPRFRRSVQIEMDIGDATSTENYIVTDFVRSCFHRINLAFQQGNTQRAWRLTGDYGSGKSAFALAVAKAAAGREQELPPALRGIIHENRVNPVVVTGDRESLITGIGRAIIQQVPSCKKQALPVTTEELLSLIEKARLAVKKEGKAGILLVLDELGKNLEYSTIEPRNSDVYCLQRLAEFASRSGDRPFIILGILHQGIASYTADLDVAAQREWDKVAGRFDEIIFSHPPEQTLLLCAEALNVDLERLPNQFVVESRRAMKWAVNSGIYGSAPSETLMELAPRLFPLHPTVLPPLLNLLRKFAQNERSLFGFLSGYEPHGLQDYTGFDLGEASFFRLSNLYDYFKANLAHTMTNGRATHWRIIESVIRQAPGSGENELEILKSIGILNLIDDDSLLATRDMLSHSIEVRNSRQFDGALDLFKSKHVLYERGAVRGYCLWPHTSVHLDDCFEEARRQLGDPVNPVQMIASLLEPQIVVARRHYIETGNLRHFEVQFYPAKEYDQLCKKGVKPLEADSDGYVIVLLPESELEYKYMEEKLQNRAHHPGTKVIVGLTRPPIELVAAAKDLQCWNWVQDNVKELSGDEFARRELKAQIRIAQDMLERRQERITGLNNQGEAGAIRWFWRGASFDLDANGIGASLSNICDSIYSECPIVNNELINRRVTSSAASRARTLLIEAISSNPDKPFLGLDASRNPPEIAIYLSVLLSGNIHGEENGKWEIVVPAKDKDKNRLRPALIAIEKLLKENDGQHVAVPRIFEELKKEPIGARDGILPLLLAIYLAAHWHQTAAFENGTYCYRLGGEEFQRLIKEPECFELQHCAIEGVRLGVFRSLAGVLGLEENNNLELLDLVRPLVKFIAEVPEYSRNTSKLSDEAKALRSVLLGARDPARLIFTDIPDAIGVGSAEHEQLSNDLPRYIAELQTSYERLLNRIAEAISDAFETAVPANQFRAELTARSKAIAGRIAEVELKSFILRLGDDKLEYRQWLESIASHLSRKSVSRWNDSDEENFYTRFVGLAKRMLRAESAHSDITKQVGSPDAERVVWLAMTKPDGVESTRLLHWSEAEESKVKQLEDQINEIIQKHGRAGLSAAARVLWDHMKDD